ncbi:MAG: aminotransferase class V-fold PLP-dependent enzyme [Nanoarchaeota archaeon]
MEGNLKIDNDVAKLLRKEFPIFDRKINGHDLIYLDNSATSQKPKQVIKIISNYYETTNANIHRGIYTISEDASSFYDDAKKTVGDLINASSNEIIFTRNTTESLNLLSYSLAHYIKENMKGKDEIVLTEFEHHSNMVPWQQMAKRAGMSVKYIKMKDDLTLDLNDAKEKITDKTALLAFTHVSNALGTVLPAENLVALAKKAGALTIIDAAQSAPHMKLDVEALGCDFMAFSSHKMLGPTGMGALYGRKDLLEALPPFNFGGDMISDVTYEDARWNEVPMKFEAGTPNIAGALGFAEAVRYLNNIGMENIGAWEHELYEHAVLKLKQLSGLKVLNAGAKNSAGIISFTIDGLHHHDVAAYLNDYGVCVRVGHHCAMPLMSCLGIQGTIRMSFYLYNTKEDIDKAVRALEGAIGLFRS